MADTELVKLLPSMKELVRLAVGHVMEEAWTYICTDTGCHPLDIEHSGRNLYFKPRHWADFTADILEPLLQESFASRISTLEGEVEKLRAENERLRKALEPFKRVAPFFADYHDGYILQGELEVGHIRSAALAMEIGK